MKQNRIIITLLACLCFSLTGLASPTTAIVQQYADALGSLVKQNSYSREQLEGLLSKSGKKAVIADPFTKKLLTHYGIGIKESYQYRTFLDHVGEYGIEGGSIKISNIEEIDKTELELKDQRQKKYVDGCTYALARMKTSNPVAFEGDVLFYVKKNGIVKVDECNVTRDIHGNRKVLVDFSDIDDDGFGYATLNYSPSLKAAGISFGGNVGWLSIGADLGYCINADKITGGKVTDFTDIRNYTMKYKELTPKAYITLTPGVYFRYFHIGCGVGALQLRGIKGTNSYTTDEITATAASTNTWRFMLRPSLKVFIPFDDDYALALSGGYEFISGAKQLNGWNFGIGLKFDTDLEKLLDACVRALNIGIQTIF